MESSSSSASENSDTGRRRKTSDIKGEPEPAVVPDQPQAPRNIPHALSAWAMERGVRRLRTDRRLGWPEEEQLNEWAAILERSGVHDPTDVFAVLDVARAAADRSGAWHNWSFLTLQVQLAAERFQLDKGGPARRSFAAPISVPDEDPMTEWAKAKEQIRGQIPEIPFLNWFNRTRQIGRCGTKILVEVPDQPTRSFLEAEYAAVVSGNLAGLGVDDVSYVAPDATAAGREGPAGHPRLLLAVK